MRGLLTRRWLSGLGALAALGFLVTSLRAQVGTVCAEVKLEILQEATLEREAFDASLKINNNLPDKPFTKLKVLVFVADDQGQPADNAFFIKVSTLSNTNAVDGTGVVQSSSTAEIHWLIIPSTGAGGTLPGGKRYSVKASITGESDGVPQTVNTFDDFITVYPQPSLKLEYVLPFEVFADEPLTTAIEPVEPFPLGVRVTNVGFGPAKNFKIDSAQPRITENKQNLAIDFRLLGTVVGGQTIPDTLLVPFGDIAAGGVGQASWVMATTLSGRFVSFTSTFTHAAELGGQLTSLIQSVTTYTLLRDVRVDLPGRDATPDFLVNASMDREAMKAVLDAGQVVPAQAILESDQPQVIPVQDLPGTVTGALGGTSSSLELGFGVGVGSNVWVRVSAPITPPQGLRLTSARSADGRTLDVKNAWISKHFRKDDTAVLYRLNVLDLTTGASYYTLQFDPAGLDDFPGVVTDLAAETGAVGGTLELSWTAPGEDGYTGHILGGSYFIQSSISSAPVFLPEFAQLHLTTSTAPGRLESFLLTGLIGNATTQVALWTQDTGGLLASTSNIASAYVAPYPPHDLVLSALSSVSVNGQWQTGNNSLPVEYQVYASSEPGVTSSASPFLDPFTSTHTFLLEPNRRYEFFGTARNPETGAMSAPLLLGAATTYAAPPAPEPYADVFFTSMTVVWGTNGNTPDTEYWVELATASPRLPNPVDAGWSTQVADWATGTSWVFTGLFAQTNYRARVKARNRDGLETVLVDLGVQRTQKTDVMPPRTTLAFSTNSFGENPTYVSGRTSFTLTAVDDHREVGDADGVGGVVHLVSVDSGPFTAYSTAPFSLSPGSHTLSYFSVDFLDNAESSRTVSVFVDTVPPTAQLVFVGPHFVNGFSGHFVSSVTRFAAEAADIESDGGASGLAQILVSTNGAIAPFVYSSTFSLPPERIVNGIRQTATHGILVSAFDNVSNEGTSPPIGEIRVDTNAPVSVMTFDGPSTRTPAGLFVRTFTAIKVRSEERRTDGVFAITSSDMRGIRVTIDGVETFFAQSSPFTFGTYAETAFDLDEGSHTVVYQGVDNVDNVELARPELVIADDTPTLIQISTETDGQVYQAATSTIPVRFTVVDALDSAPAVSAALVQVEDRGSPRGARPGSVPVTAGQDLGPFALDDGLWRLEVAATDAIGNSTSAAGGTFEVVFPADTLPPTTTLVVSTPSVVVGSVAYVSELTPLSLAASDDLHAAGDGLGYGVRSTSYSVDGGPFQLYTGPFFLTAHGPHELRYYSEDVFGQVETQVQSSVIVDNRPPVLNITAPAAGTVTLPGPVNVSAVYSDPSGVSLASVQVYVDDVDRTADASIGPGGVSISVDATDGPHRVWISIRDRAGNVAAESVEFRVDGGPTVAVRVKTGVSEPDLGGYSNRTDVLAAGEFASPLGLSTGSLSLLVDSAPRVFDVSTQSPATAGWSNVTSIGDPAPVNAQGFAAEKDRLLLLGGWNSFGNRDGRLLSFDALTGLTKASPLPFPVAEPHVFLVDNVVYFTGGNRLDPIFASESYSAETWYSFLSRDGLPLQWRRTTPLFTIQGQFFEGLIGGSAVAVPGASGARLYLFGGNTSSSEHSGIRRVTVQADKSLGVWGNPAVSPTQLTAIYGVRTVYHAGRLYMAGGFSQQNYTGPSAAVRVIDVDAEGNIESSWDAGPDLPEARGGGALFVARGRLYYAGGRDGAGNARADVYAAPILEDGSLGAWTTETGLPFELDLGGGAFLNEAAYVAPSALFLVKRSFDERITSAQIHSSEALAEGSYLIESAAADLRGVSRSGSRTFIVDLTTPTSHLETAGSSRVVEGILQVAAQQALSILAADPVSGGTASGIEFTRVTVSGGAERDGARFFIPQGYQTLSFYSQDRAGNREASQAMTVFADGVAPAGVTDLAVAASSQTAVTLTWTATGEDGVQGDIIGGEERVHFSTYAAGLSSASAQYVAAGDVPAGQAREAVVTGLLPGTTYHLAVWTRDQLGNYSDRSNVVVAQTQGLPDATPPVTTLLVSTAAVELEGQAFYPGAAYFGFVSSDTGSGVARVDYRLDGSTESFLVYAGTFSLAEGTRSVEWAGVDVAGNRESTSTASFVVDASAPLTFLEASGVSGTDGMGRLLISTATLLSLNAVDRPSSGTAAGVAATLFSLDGPLGAGATVYSAPFALAPGTYTLRFASVDRVGNLESEKTQELAVSTRPFNAAPATVTDLLALTGADGGALALAWTAPDDDATPGERLNGTYLIQHSTEASPVFDPALAQVSRATVSAPGAAESLALAGLLGNATHQLRLWTRDDEGAVSAAAAASAYARPNPPQGLVLSEVSSTSARADWQPGGNAEPVEYQVYAATAADGPAVSASPFLGSASGSHVFDALAPDTTYFFLGYGRDAASQASGPAVLLASTRTAPADAPALAPAATDLAASTGPVPGSVLLSWTAGNSVSSGAYRVGYSTSGTPGSVAQARLRIPAVAVSNGQSQSAVLYLVPNSSYTFVLWAEEGAQVSPPSNAASALTGAAPPVPALIPDVASSVDLDFFPFNGIASLALDPSGALWATWFNGSGLRRVPPPFVDEQTPDVVIGWPSNDPLGAILAPLAFDAQGDLWAQSIFTSGPRVSYLLKFSPPFVSGMRPEATASPFDLGSGNNAMAWDRDGGLLILRDTSVSRYLPPFSPDMAPVATLTGPRFNTRGMAMDPAGRVWLADFDTLLGYEPPFSGTMTPTYFVSGLPQIDRINFDRSGGLWVMNASGQAVRYEPPYVSGMAPARVYATAVGYPQRDAEGALWTGTQGGASALKTAAHGILEAGTDAIALAWNDNGNAPGTRYELQVATDAAFSTPRASALVTGGSVTIGGLSPDTSYYARGRAYDEADRPSAFVLLGSTRTLALPPALGLSALAPSSATTGQSASVAAAGAGFDATTTLALERLDAAAGAWSAAAALDGPRQHHGAVRLDDGRVLVAGGSADSVGGSFLDGVRLFDPAAGAWTAAAPMSQPRYAFTLVKLRDGRVLAANGQSSGGYTATAELYAPASGVWTPTGSMLRPTNSAAAVLLADGKVLVTGGYDGVTENDVELYDPATGAWSARASMSQARASHSLTRLADGRVLAAGGVGAGGANQASAEVYDPVADAWTTVSPMATTRYAHGAALLPDGRVLVLGGAGDAGMLASAELFDPATGSWAPAASMSSARYAPGVEGVDGRVLAAGGLTPGGGVASAELYDAPHDAWTPFASMADARYLFTLTRLTDGRLLAVGGEQNASPLSAAELFSAPAATIPATGIVVASSAALTGTLDLAGAATGYWDAVVARGDGARARLGAAFRVLAPGAPAEPVLTSITVSPSSASVAVGGSQAFAAVGTFSDGSTRAFVSATGAWESKAGLGTARADAAGAYVGGKLYVIGGSPPAGFATTAVEAYDPATDAWTARAPAPISRAAAAAAVHDGKVYVVGGCVNSDCGSTTGALYVYDPAADSWTQKASMPNPRYEMTFDALGGLLYAVGGFQPGHQVTNLVQAYDPATDSWTSKASLPFGRGQAAAGVINGKLYVANGQSSTTQEDELQVYDPVANSWSQGPVSPLRRQGDAGAVLDGKLYVMGGISTGAAVSEGKRALVFDPATNAWSDGPALSVARYSAVAAAGDGRVFVAAGGFTNNAIADLEVLTLTSEVVWSVDAPAVATVTAQGVATGLAAGTAQVIASSGAVSGQATLEVASPVPTLASIAVQPATATVPAGQSQAFTAVGTFTDGSTRTLSGANGWTELATMPLPRRAYAAAATGGKLYVLGGLTDSGQATSDVQVYDTGAGAWSVLAPMPGPRAVAMAAAVGGKVYLIGGCTIEACPSGAGSVGTVSVFDPATGAWTTGQPMPTPRYYLGGAAIGGKIYAAGGFVAPATASDALEVYDPAADSWVAGPAMGAPHWGAGFAALGDELYVIGGFDAASVQRRVDAYDVSAGSWTRKADLPDAWRYGLAGGAVGGKVYAMGGTLEGSPDQGSTRVDVYDPAADAWAPGPQLPQARGGLLAGVEHAGRLYVAGGGDAAGSATATLFALGGSEVAWSVDAPAVATVTAQGVATGLAAGAAQVIATSGAVSGFATLTVEAVTPTLTSIAVLPATATVASGDSQAFTAVGTFSDGSTRAFASASGAWRTNAPLGTARTGAASAFADGRFYVFGGSPPAGFATTSVEAYDPAADAWTSRAPSPVSRSYAAAAAIGTKVYVTGGCVNSDCGSVTSALWEYDTVADAWTARAAMPSPRFDLAFGAIDGKLYAAGGMTPGFGQSAALHVYDPATDSWSTKASMPIARGQAAGAAVGGKLYVSGGSPSQAELQIYDAASDSWSVGPSQPLGRVVQKGAALGGKFYAVGGQSSGSASPHDADRVFVYDPAAGAWSEGPALSVPRYGPSLGSDGTRLYAAGSLLNNISTSTLEVLTLESGLAWSVDAPAVATVTAQGVATGLAAGSAQVIATSGPISGFATLTVNATYFVAASTDGLASLNSHRDDMSVTPVSTEAVPAAYAAAVGTQSLVLAMSSLYELSPSPVAFDPAATLSFLFDPTQVDTATLAIFRYNDPLWSSAPVAAQSIEYLSTGSARISGLLASASLYGLFYSQAESPSLPYEFVRDIGVGRLSQPVGAAITLNSNLLYVTDPGRIAVDVYNLDGGVLSSFGSPGSGPGQFGGQVMMAPGPAGDAAGLSEQSVYVADPGNHRIQLLSRFGGFQSSVGSEGTGDGQFQTLYWIAVGTASGRIYATDSSLERVQSFLGSDSSFAAGWGSPGSEPGQFNGIRGVAAPRVDGLEVVLVVDAGNRRVQRFNPFGIYLGSFALDEAVDPQAIAAGPDGRLYVSDPTLGAVFVFDRDGVPLGRVAAGEALSQPMGLALDALNRLYVAERGSGRVRVLRPVPQDVTPPPALADAAPLSNSYVGLRVRMSAPADDGPSGRAALYQARFSTTPLDTPQAIVDARPLLVSFTPSTPGTLETLRFAGLEAGTPYHIAVRALDAVGNEGAWTVLSSATMADLPPGYLTRWMGGGSSGGLDGLKASANGVASPRDVAVDAAGNVFVAQAYVFPFGQSAIQRVDGVTLDSAFYTKADQTVFNGDGLHRLQTTLVEPGGVAVDASGNVYAADFGDHRVRRIDAVSGLVATVAGNGAAGFSGDGGPAASASLNGPRRVSVAPNGDLYIADGGNHRVRRVRAANGLIDTVAGDGTAAYSGDGGPATAAALNAPRDAKVGPDGRLYIADTANHRVRRVDPETGLVQTVVGDGVAGGSGEGGPASAARVNAPAGLAFDPFGRLYVSELLGNRTRRVELDGTITRVAGLGNGAAGQGLDAPARSVGMTTPNGMALDAFRGILYVTNSDTNLIDAVGVERFAQVVSTSLVAGQPELTLFSTAPFAVASVSSGTGAAALAAAASQGLVPAGSLFDVQRDVPGTRARLTLRFDSQVVTDSSTLAVWSYDGLAWSSMTTTDPRRPAEGADALTGLISEPALYALFTVNGDTVAPSVSIAFSTPSFLFSDGSLAIGTRAVVSLATDDPSATIRYAVDAPAPSLVYVSPFALEAGTRTVYFEAVDEANNGSGVSSATVYVASVPFVGSVDRSSGPIGQPLVLRGFNFRTWAPPATSLRFGASTSPVTVWNDAQVSASVPGIASGEYALTLTALQDGQQVTVPAGAFTVLTPAIASVTPSSAPIGGVFTLTGEAFGPYGGANTRVLIGGATTPISVWNDAKIVGTVPGALEPGVYDLLVERRTADGGVSQSSTVSFQVAGIAIAALNPSTGPIGVPFTLSGSGFGAYGGANTQVLFGSTAAVVSVWNDATIAGTVPSLSTGVYPVVVRRVQGGGEELSAPTTFTLTALTLSAPVPSSAPIGSAFTLTGTGFGPYAGANTRLLVAGATVPVSVWNDTTITGTLIALPPGPQPLWLERRSGAGLQASNTVYIDVLAPGIAALNPSTGPIGIPFTLSGSGFGVYGGANTQVLFGSTAAVVSVWNDTSISGTVPSLSTGVYPVVVRRVQGGGEELSAPATFTLTALELAPPTPSSGPIGTSFTLSGTGFGPYAGANTRLLLGGSTATVTVWNDTTITGVVPALPLGPQPLWIERVSGAGLQASATVEFLVTGQSIASVSPSTGPVGVPFTVTGSGFGAYGGANTRILFGGVAATVSVWNDTTISGSIPLLATGTHAVVVERVQGSSVSASAPASFELTALTLAVPTPSSGPAGVSFTLSGPGFGPYGGANTRLLLGGTTVTVSVWNDATITGVVPALPAGPQPLWLERKAGTGLQASNTVYFDVLTPGIASLDPSTGPIGIPFTLTGSGFGTYGGANTQVRFGTVAATISVWNDSTIKGTVPALATGAYDLIVRRVQGGVPTDSAPSTFTVLAPAPVGITPSSAPIGAPFTITGTAFGPYGGANTRVKFDGVAATVSVWNDGTISGTVPGAVSTGTVDVVVERAVGTTVSASEPLAFLVLRPTISTITPSFGPTGTLVTLSGSGFGPYGGTATRLLVGGSTMTVSVWNDSTIRWTVPAGLADGTHEVVVQRQPAGGSVASEPVEFTKGTGFGGASLFSAAPLSATPDVYFEGGMNLPADEGGRIETPAAAAVTVPAGALEADEVITIARDKDSHKADRLAALAREKLGAAGEPIEFGPSGTRFAVPVTIELPYDPGLFPGGLPATLAVHYFDPAAKTWTPLPTQVDAARRVLIARTDHFSLYQPLAPGIGVAAVDDFSLRDQYVFPNPSRRGESVTFRVQPGRADSVELRVYDLAGRRVHSSSDFRFTASYDDGNGKGPQHTYDHVWSVSGVGSGVYYYVIVSKKAGQSDIVVKGKVGVIK